MTRRGRSFVPLACLALAFAVRFWWIRTVQSPFDAIYLDMEGYLTRARWMLAGTVPSEPRILALWPWGTHAILGLELAILKSRPAIEVWLAFIGAIPAGCTAALAARISRSAVVSLVAGVAVALWQPQIVYVGFFLSELWFFAAVSLQAWLYARADRSRVCALGAGVAGAIAFVSRPQFILTFAILLGLSIAGAHARGAWSFRRPWPSRRALATAVLLAAPLVLTVAGSAHRLHRLTGAWGLISDNGAVQRLFGATSVDMVKARWTAPNGDGWEWWFAPPTKRVPPIDIVEFDGYFADAKILSRIQKERLARASVRDQLERAFDNTDLLFARNVPWPERNHATSGWRREAQRWFAQAARFVWPAGVIGFAVTWPRRPKDRRVHLCMVASTFTMLVAAALYIGEARYRIAYDPFAILAAACGVDAALRALYRRLVRSRRA